MTFPSALRALAIAGVLAIPGAALAQGTPAITMEQARKIATGQGMVKVEEIELDDGKWEVEGRDAGGYEIEVDIRASDGLILKIDRDRRSPIKP